MVRKTSLGRRVYCIAGDNNVEQTSVSRIINSYISICREDLLNGHVINFFGLVSVIPNYVTSEYTATMAWYAKKVSEKLSMPYHTCFEVIKNYIKSLTDDLMSGKPIDIRGIVSLHPVTENGVLCKIHASISTSIKEDLLVKNGVVTSARAHTCKLLKHNVYSLAKNTEA